MLMGAWSCVGVGVLLKFSYSVMDPGGITVMDPRWLYWLLYSKGAMGVALP